MNQKDFKFSFIEKTCEVVKKGLSDCSLIEDLYFEHEQAVKSKIDDLEQKNNLLIDTFEILSKAYGLELNIGFTQDQLQKNIFKFKKKISDLALSTKPKQLYLVYSWRDEYGHSYCNCITEKSTKYTRDLINYDICMEHLYTENSKLLIAMSKRGSKSIDMFLNTKEEVLLNEITKFFKSIVNDESVSLQQFSEYFECIVCTDRHSGSAIKWITL